LYVSRTQADFVSAGLYYDCEQEVLLLVRTIWF